MCEDAERLTRVASPHVAVSGSIPLRDTFYAGITRRDFNPRRCLLRNSARGFSWSDYAAPLWRRRPRPRCRRRLSITANTVILLGDRVIYSPGRDPFPARGICRVRSKWNLFRLLRY